MANVPITDIIVPERRQSRLRNIPELAQSISEIGLLHPVVIRPDNTLVAGERRLAAVRQLGWQSVPATVVTGLDDATRMLQAERDENVCRLDLTPLEAIRLGQELEEIERPAAKERMVDAHASGAKLAQQQQGKTRDKVGDAVGMGHSSYDKGKAIVKAAESDPETYGDLLDELEKPRSVDRAYRELTRRQDAREIVDVPPPTGKYRVIVVDPPWDFSDESDASQMGRGRPLYSAMPIDDVEALPIVDLAADNCHMYLWITNRSLPKGFRLLDAWGFRYITLLTWCKPHIGLGNYFRISTEHLMFGVKGAQRLTRFDQGTWFQAPRGKRHSEKPQEAYDLIASCSPGPRLDMFARAERDGFVAWGNVE